MTTMVKTPLEKQLEAFIQTLQWSTDATEYQKTLVLGNLRGFVSFVQRDDESKDQARVKAKVNMSHAWESLHSRMMDQQRVGGAATIDDLLDVLELVMAELSLMPVRG